MPEKSNESTNINIQDDYLNKARKEKIILAVFFTNGKKIIGRVRNFDRFTILLELANRQDQLIFKHAISSMTPAKFLKNRMHFSLD
ncbi:MAG: RNA chaperone Hfq [Acidobacteria bacterium]|nr:MAG: RNA chaperone Hfq [Acidobacteriota bacterium]PIE90850.1 MAG: RNA chaperone Hfq [Acidobacteriota bacterium]